MLSFDSPRYSFRNVKFTDVQNALDTIGHVVLDDVWNPEFFSELRKHAVHRFESDDARRARKEDVEDLRGYMGGELNVATLFGSTESGLAQGSAYNQKIAVEFERAGLPALLRHLFNGSCVLGETAAQLRRVDPKFPVRFIGLHNDGQLNICSSRGIASQREFTLWTPMQDCTDDKTPRLLLLHRRESLENVFTDSDKVKTESTQFLPVALNTDPIGAETAYLAKADNNLDRFFGRLYAEKECYSPRVPLGSAVLFDSPIVHGSYRTDKMTTARYSVDIRMVPEFRTTWNNCEFVGTTFRSGSYPPRGIKYSTKKAAFQLVLAKEFIKFAPRAAYRRISRYCGLSSQQPVR